MNRFLQDKKPSNSVDTDFFWRDTPSIEKSLEGSYQEKEKFNTLAFCEFVDDVVNMNKLSYDTTPDNLSGYVDITGWNDMFNINSIGSEEDANIIPNYYNLFVENKPVNAYYGFFCELK